MQWKQVARSIEHICNRAIAAIKHANCIGKYCWKIIITSKGKCPSSKTCGVGRAISGETLLQFADTYKLPVISVADIYQYQQSLEVTALTSQAFTYEFDWAEVELENGKWSLATYPSLRHREHLVMRFGTEGKVPLVRIHSECFTGDVLHSRRCDCGEQLAKSLALIEERGYGFVIYLRDHEGRGIGLTEKLKAYKLQNEGLDTVEANIALGHGVDLRDWSDSIAILDNLGLTEIDLLTNNPEKVEAVRASGIACTQLPLTVEPNPFNIKYLQTKSERLGHIRSK